MWNIYTNLTGKLILVKDLLNFKVYISFATKVILVKSLLISSSKGKNLDIAIFR